MQNTNVPNDDNKSDVDLDSMCLLLDPHLRPATPDLTDPRSKALFDEHKQLAQEYLTVSHLKHEKKETFLRNSIPQVQTELALLSQKRNKLLEAQTDEQQRQRRAIQQLQSEKESLQLLKQRLQVQKELLEANSTRIPNDGWVIVPRHESEL